MLNDVAIRISEVQSVFKATNRAVLLCAFDLITKNGHNCNPDKRCLHSSHDHCGHYCVFFAAGTAIRAVFLPWSVFVSLCYHPTAYMIARFGSKIHVNSRLRLTCFEICSAYTMKYTQCCLLFSSPIASSIAIAIAECSTDTRLFCKTIFREVDLLREHFSQTIALVSIEI